MNWHHYFLHFGMALFVSIAMQGCTSKSDEQKPLYWVAPMDPNYRRDQPGQSPMGMDLIPVYEEAEQPPGEITLAPEVQLQIGVRVQPAALGQLQITLRAPGKIVFDQTQISKLSPRVTGWVDMLFVATEGESVKRGQPLYALYSPELIQAQQNYLSQIKRGSQQAILEAESHLLALKMDPIAINELKRDGVPQQSVIFRSPKDGVIGMLNIAEDNYVEPGDLLMAVGSLEAVWAEFNVFESHSGLIEPQQPVRFSAPAYPDLIWEGEIDYIYPALTAQERTLKFRTQIDNPKMRLKPNMHIQGVLLLPQREESVLIPKSALMPFQDHFRVVQALGNGRYKSVKVIPGASTDDQVEIQQGLEENDQVVVSAQFLIDSESSKTSDFLRMSTIQESTPQYPTTWVDATVIEVDLVQRTLRLEHDYIEDWKMPSMTMNFQAEDGLAIKHVEVGSRIHAQISDGDPLFQIKSFKPMSKGR